MSIPSWLYISQLTGNSGTTVITVSAGTNTNYNELATIISVDTNNLYENIIINQQSTNIRPSLKVLPISIDVPQSGGTYQIYISANTEWVVNYPTWVTGTKSSGNSDEVITITVSSNSGSERSESIIINNDITSRNIVINQEPYIDYEREYLCLKIVSGGTIGFKRMRGTGGQGSPVYVYFSINGGNWMGFTPNYNGTPSISVSPGDTIRWKGTNKSYSTDYNFAGYGHSFYGVDNAKFKIYGNLMSMIYGDNFINQTVLESGYTFSLMFKDCNALVDASKLILPATTLTEHCYEYMFMGSTVTKAPEILPAQTLPRSSYMGMFNGCRSLTTAPDIAATTLGPNSCANMFYVCPNLERTPVFSATTLSEHCCINMFRSCTSLRQAPELLATSLAYNCYNGMFQNCTSLNYIKCLATDISASQCTSNWVSGVQTTSGTFVKAAGISWPSGTDGIPNNWTVINN